jgi:hypothetical protein
MARWIVAGLVVLNLMLGIGVYLRMESKAQAQIGRGGGAYATVSGTWGGDTYVYILELNKGHLVAIKTSGGQVKTVAARDVAKDLERIK